MVAGNLEAAFNAAMSSGLWEHSLALGHFLGPQHIQRAVKEFATADLSALHPLRLAYLQLSGQGSVFGTTFPTLSSLS
jgi:hypothetical protein